MDKITIVRKITTFIVQIMLIITSFIALINSNAVLAVMVMMLVFVTQIGDSVLDLDKKFSKQLDINDTQIEINKMTNEILIKQNQLLKDKDNQIAKLKKLKKE